MPWPTRADTLVLEFHLIIRLMAYHPLTLARARDHPVGKGLSSVFRVQSLKYLWYLEYHQIVLCWLFVALVDVGRANSAPGHFFLLLVEYCEATSSPECLTRVMAIM